MNTDPVTLAIFLVIAAVILGVLFAVFRGFTLWYFRIDTHITNQEQIISLLRQQVEILQSMTTPESPAPQAQRQNPLTRR